MDILNRRLFSFIICILFVGSIFSMPSRKNLKTYIQPDGLEVSVELVGDEYGSFYLTTDGMMVDKDSDGIWKYVIAIENDYSKLSQISAHNSIHRNAEEHKLIQSINQRTLIEEGNKARNKKMLERSLSVAPRNILTRSLSKNVGPYSTNGYPSVGNIKGLVILAQFPDKSFSMGNTEIKSHYNDILNKSGYSDSISTNNKKYLGAIGSVKDYFESQSFGLFSPTFDVIGPITANYGYAYYGANVGGVAGDDSKNASKLISEVCSKARSLVNFADYDANSDGIVDFVYVIYAGQGENFTGSDPNTIWPHQWETSLQVGTKVVRSYACSAELFYNSNDILDGIGTICHEFSHIIGLPDFYSVTGNEDVFAMSSWSVMDYGSYDNDGFAPTGYTAFERYSLGWMDLTDISDPGSYSLPDVGESGVAFRLRSASDNQFIILENHQKEGWYRFQNGSGLMATAIYYDKNLWCRNEINEYPDTKRYYILPADNKYSDATLYGDLFPFENKDSITLNSSPASQINNGNPISISILNIRKDASAIIFDIPQNTLTEIRNTEAMSPSASCIDGVVTVKAKRGTRVIIYSVAGSVISNYTTTADEEQFVLPSAGIYIIKCGDKTFKAIK